MRAALSIVRLEIVCDEQRGRVTRGASQVMVDGVVRSSYDEVGRGDWADLDYKLDSLPTQVGILSLVAISIAISSAFSSGLHSLTLVL